MGDISTAVIGLLLLVPVILVFIVAYTAIKCSEWHIWIAHSLIGRRIRGDSRLSTTTGYNSSHNSEDLEKGVTEHKTS